MLDRDASLTDMSYRLSRHFEAVNTKYIKLIAQQIRDIGTIKPTNMRRLQELARTSKNIKLINEELAKASNLTLQELFTIYDKSGLDTYMEMGKYYKANGVKQMPFSENVLMQQYIRSIKQLTLNTFINLSRTTVMDRMYKDAVDEAIIAISSGIGDYTTEVRPILSKVAGTGIQVQYTSGYRRRLDSAIRMNILEGVRQVNDAVRIQAGREFKANGIQISAHANCAPDHIDIQGKQFPIREFERLNNSLDRPIGTLNCRHFKMPCVLGADSIYNPEYLAKLKKQSEKVYYIDGKQYTSYEATQLMRRLETEMRYAKDKVIAGRESGDDVLMQRGKDKLQKLYAKYRQVTKITGLTKQLQRAAVPGYRI